MNAGTEGVEEAQRGEGRGGHVEGHRRPIAAMRSHSERCRDMCVRE